MVKNLYRLSNIKKVAKQEMVYMVSYVGYAIEILD